MPSDAHLASPQFMQVGTKVTVNMGNRSGEAGRENWIEGMVEESGPVEGEPFPGEDMYGLSLGGDYADMVDDDGEPITTYMPAEAVREGGEPTAPKPGDAPLERKLVGDYERMTHEGFGPGEGHKGAV